LSLISRLRKVPPSNVKLKWVQKDQEWKRQKVPERNLSLGSGGGASTCHRRPGSR